MTGSIRQTRRVTFASHQFEFPGGPALYWPDEAALIVADVHLGKGATFRSAGLPVPAGSSERDLHRLTQLVQTTQARRLIILGDFLHARSGLHPELLEQIARWRSKMGQVNILLVRGNHDVNAGPCPEEWDIEQVSGSIKISGIELTHDPGDPDSEPEAPRMSGHIHPACTLRDFDGSSARLPCFVFEQRLAILPAFASLAGGVAVKPQPGRQIFVLAGSNVVPFADARKL